MKTHDKQFDKCYVENHFRTDKYDYPEIILFGTFIYKGMSSKFIITFTLRDFTILRDCILRNQI